MTSICIGANCLYGPRLGGHAWVYLNWALGARANGFDVVWLEGVSRRTEVDEVTELLATLRSNLRHFGLDDSVVLCSWSDSPLRKGVADLTPAVEDAYQAEAFIDLVYDLPASVVTRFRRTALINIDPGLLEAWMTSGDIRVADHDIYFTIGARSFDSTRDWHRTTPCVSLDEWTASEGPRDGAFTTVTGWYANEWIEEEGKAVRNDKRTSFMQFLDVPRHSNTTLELALDLQDDPDQQRTMLLERGWRVADASLVTPTPEAYRSYVRASVGEFGCCKPFHARQATGWISDRTVCYLASGRPAIVQDTGPHPALDDGRGVLRFSTPEEAVACLEKCTADYPDYSRAARVLAEERFDAHRVVGEVLERIV